MLCRAVPVDERARRPGLAAVEGAPEQQVDVAVVVAGVPGRLIWGPSDSTGRGDLC